VEASARRHGRPFAVIPLHVVAGFFESERVRRDSGVFSKCGMTSRELAAISRTKTWQYPTQKKKRKTARLLVESRSLSLKASAIGKDERICSVNIQHGKDESSA
jgi:hypothetical protein